MDDQEINEFFNERAAMIEHDGGKKREDSEVDAYWEAKKKYGRVTELITKIYAAAQRKRLSGE